MDLLVQRIAPQPTPAQPIRTTTEYRYDANGNRTFMRDPNNLAASYDYDPSNRLRQIDYPGTVAIPERGVRPFNAFSVVYTYDLLGQRRTMTDPTNGETRYSYDELGRLTTTLNAATLTAVGYAYDIQGVCPTGKGTRLSYPDGVFTATSCYDAAYRLKSVGVTYAPSGQSHDEDKQYFDFDYTYDYAGRLRMLTYPNQTRANYSYDGANRLTGVMHERLVAAAGGGIPLAGMPAAPGMAGLLPGTDPAEAGLLVSPPGPGPFYTQTLELDNVGSRTRINEVERYLFSARLGYDTQNRLRSVTYDDDVDHPLGYTYSPHGNRETVTIDGATHTFGYDNAKRLQSARVKGMEYAYEYDANGNEIYSHTTDQTPMRSTVLGYDGANQLAWSQSSEAIEGVATEYRYDGDGLLVDRRTVGGTIETYVWDINRDVPVILDDRAYVYIYGTGNAPLAKLPRSQPNVATYYHRDGLGSTRATTDKNRYTTATCNYDPWGQIYDDEPGNGCAEAVAFAGERREGSTGTYYLRARRYDPGTGRFTQPDPIGDAGGMNHYAYAANNPQTLVDPTGLDPENVEENAVPSVYSRAELERRTRQGTRGDWTVAFEMTLARADWGTDDDTHFASANAALDAELSANPALAKRLASYNPSAIGATLRSNGRRLTPAGWRWHHHATRQGVMQLVLQSEHKAGSPFWRLMHPGGRGGYKNWAEPAGAKPRRGEH